MTMNPRAKAEMLIRKPVADVFEAFVDPRITSKFWFSGGSAQLEPGITVTWEWAMYGFSIPVHVKAVEKNLRILVEWPGDDAPTTVEWMFNAHPDGSTSVSITNAGFTGDEDKRVAQALDSTEGFAFVLAGAKAWLEHGIQLNLVPDREPRSRSLAQPTCRNSEGFGQKPAPAQREATGVVDHGRITPKRVIGVEIIGPVLAQDQTLGFQDGDISHRITFPCRANPQ